MLNNYVCDNKVFHSRLKPFKNYFSYNICSIIFDLKKINLIKKLKFLSINKFNIFSINLNDYGNYNKNLFNFLKEKIKKKFNKNKDYNIYLLTSPKFLGYVFNPISIYFVSHKKKIEFIIYEVRNTHGEKHMYFKKVINNKKISHLIEKKLYVSPFLSMDLKYFFKLKINEKNINISIDAFKNKELLKTGMFLRNFELNDKNLIKIGLKRLFYAQKIIILIHYQAIKILLKKAKFNFKKKLNKNSFSFS